MALTRRQFVATTMALPIAATAGGSDAATPGGGAAAAGGVEIRAVSGGHALIRDGTPFLIRGAAALNHFDDLAAAGGNTIRTYETGHLDHLDVAHAAGLAAVVGLPMAHARHGVDYGDARARATQLEAMRAIVRRLRAHPATLMWVAGNELELDNPDPAAAWAAIEEVASMVRSEDPAHPVATGIADFDAAKIDAINNLCPTLDLLCVNSFGGSPPTVPRRLREAGWTRPFILGEFGNIGIGEAAWSPWGAPYEPNTTERTRLYEAAWQEGVAAEPGFALGGFAFLWGWKQEATHTWHSMYLPDGPRLGPVETMARLWGGALPGRPAPRLAGFATGADPGTLRPGQPIRAQVALVADEPAEGLRFAWELRRENRDRAQGGEPEAMPAIVAGVLRGLDGGAANGREVEIHPPEPGAYRLFVSVLTGDGGAASANLPLRVLA